MALDNLSGNSLAYWLNARRDKFSVMAGVDRFLHMYIRPVYKIVRVKTGYAVEVQRRSGWVPVLSLWHEPIVLPTETIALEFVSACMADYAAASELSLVGVRNLIRRRIKERFNTLDRNDPAYEAEDWQDTPPQFTYHSMTPFKRLLALAFPPRFRLEAKTRGDDSEEHVEYTVQQRTFRGEWRPVKTWNGVVERWDTKSAAIGAIAKWLYGFEAARGKTNREHAELDRRMGTGRTMEEDNYLLLPHEV